MDRMDFVQFEQERKITEEYVWSKEHMVDFTREHLERYTGLFALTFKTLPTMTYPDYNRLMKTLRKKCDFDGAKAGRHNAEASARLAALNILVAMLKAEEINRKICIVPESRKTFEEASKITLDMALSYIDNKQKGDPLRLHEEVTADHPPKVRSRRKKGKR